MKINSLIIAGTFVISTAAFASTINEKKIFNLEKSLNSENVLTIVTQTDENCKFISKNNDYIDFYWLMDGVTKKEVHPMIRTKVQERVKFVGINKDRTSFNVRLNDLSEIRHDLENNIIEIRSEINQGICTVKSILKLGASAKYRLLNLKRTFCEVQTNMIGVPNGCQYLELLGTDGHTNESIRVRFRGK